MRYSVRYLPETALACAGVLAWSLAGGLATQDVAYAQEPAPMPIEVPIPDEGPADIGEDENPPPAKPAPAPKAQPKAEPEPGPAAQPPPKDVQASGDQGAAGDGPARPSRGASSSPFLQPGVGAGAMEDFHGGGNVLAPMVAAPGVSVAPPASEADEELTGQDLAASPVSLGQVPGGEQPTMPSMTVLSALAVGLAWYERRHRARFRPRV